MILEEWYKRQQHDQHAYGRSQTCTCDRLQSSCAYYWMIINRKTASVLLCETQQYPCLQHHNKSVHFSSTCIREGDMTSPNYSGGLLLLFPHIVDIKEMCKQNSIAEVYPQTKVDVHVVHIARNAILQHKISISVESHTEHHLWKLENGDAYTDGNWDSH